MSPTVMGITDTLIITEVTGLITEADTAASAMAWVAVSRMIMAEALLTVAPAVLATA